MNKRTRKYLTLFITILTVSCMVTTLFAAQGGKRVRVYLTDGVKYTLDGKEILPKTTTIILKDKAYASVEELAKALGYTVEVKGDAVIITPSKPTPPTPPVKPVPPTPPTKPEANVTIPKAEIVAVNFTDKTVSVLPVGKANQVSNLIQLKVTDKTTITDGKTKKAYSISDLNTGMQVQVVHSAAMTKSIPPQTVAETITILSPTAPTKPEGTVTIPKAEIMAINFANNTVSVLPAGKANEVANLIDLKVSDKTTITDGKTKKAYSIKDLNTGMQVQVVHSSAMTNSIPPQTAAITITLLK